MPWNGNGRFNRTNGVFNGPTLWDATENDDRDIRTDDHDTHDEDLANGLELCLTRDGQNSPTAALPMNGQKHTGVAAASADSEYAQWGQTKTRISNAVSTLENSLAPSLATLTDGATISWNVGENPVAQVTAAGNRRLANPTGAVEGGVYILTFKQDATGGRSLDYESDFDFGEEGRPTLSGGANRADTMSFLYRDSKMRLVGIAKGFS